MKETKYLQPQEMIELENWLKQNKNKILNLSEWIETFSNLTEEKRNYLILAHLLPQKEIEEAIEYYDGHKFPIAIDELVFVNNLAKKYSVDKRMIIERFIQVRMIKQHQKNEIKVKKRKK